MPSEKEFVEALDEYCENNIQARNKKCLKCEKQKPNFKMYEGFICKLLPKKWQQQIIKNSIKQKELGFSKKPF